MRSFVFALFFCALLAFAAADTERYKNKGSSSTQNIVLDLDGDCNYKYIAVEIENAKVDISSVEVKDYRAKSWSTMKYNSAKNEYEISYQTRINFPISFQIVSVDGETIIVTDAYRSLRGYDKVDTGKQFSTGTGTSAPTSAPTTPAEDVTVKPDASRKTTKAPKPSKTKTTAAARPSQATSKPTTTAAARPPQAATSKATSAATTRPSTIPSGGSGCSAPMKMMIPLYTYPGSTWDTVIAGAKTVKTVAIINPNSGPGNGPDSAFKTYTKKMNDAGVEMVGYVHTSYGARSIATVKAEINVYAQEFQYVSGIFLDEASASASQLPYYQELHDYIMSLPGFKYNVINPGAVPAAGYANAATQIVTFESSASSFASSSNPSWANCNNKDMFVAISYGASSSSSMQSFINTANSKGYYGWAYVNDGSLSGGTYNRVPSYYAQQASAMASL